MFGVMLPSLDIHENYSLSHNATLPPELLDRDVALQRHGYKTLNKHTVTELHKRL